ncbi:PREDICTED: uncharacterized protein LOC109114104 [Nelumbo nucifera]|uniref:Uncharacterized protein LOC109114104 n=1 Tax=Nelumbo nucifera TaxID=4432 RepID=A0A1U8PYZ6_NELNU|nr:PREDICTED: uncharacterized protein LOC109114104 [Nelumbo nucifera]
MRIPRQGRSSLRVNLSTSSQEPPGDAQASQQLEINMPEPQSQQTEDRASSQSTRTRGATAAADVWSMPSDEKIDLEFNEDGQPINENAKRLTRFLGSIARNGNKLPIDVDSWRDVPIETKEEVWKVVQTKFKTKENDKDFVLKSLSKKWRGWKCDLKKKYFDFDPHNADKVQIRDDQIHPQQWKNMVQYWKSEQGRMSILNNLKMKILVDGMINIILSFMGASTV